MLCKHKRYTVFILGPDEACCCLHVPWEYFERGLSVRGVMVRKYDHFVLLVAVCSALSCCVAPITCFIALVGLDFRDINYVGSNSPTHWCPQFSRKPSILTYCKFRTALGRNAWGSRWFCFFVCGCCDRLQISKVILSGFRCKPDRDPNHPHHRCPLALLSSCGSAGS